MRFFKICFVLTKYLVFFPVNSHREECFGERFKLASEELGITFIKLGQGLSMRYDLFSARDCEAMQKLLDKTNGIRFDEIRRVLEHDYKGSYNRIFQEFDKDPIGSASVSQVHRAVLHNGTVVAVKIKRPNVDKYLRSDIRIIKVVVLFVMIFSKTLRDFRALEVVRFYDEWIQQDIDFRLEAKNIKRLRAQEASKKSTTKESVVCMDVYNEYCTDNIIVMDYINGIPMSRKKELLANKDFDIEQSVRTYVTGATKSWFRDDLPELLFQADPHLSNILALPNGGVANIDCGLVCSLTKKESAIFKKMTVGIYLKDAKTIIQIAADWAGMDYDECKKRMEKDLRRYFDKTDDEGIAFWFFELTKIFAKHKIKYPSYLIALGRANTVLHGLVSTYLPDYKLIDLLGKELKDQTIKRLKNEFNGAYFLRTGNIFLEKLRENFEDTDEFLGAISDFSRALQGEYIRKSG